MRLRFLLSATVLSSCLLGSPLAAQEASLYKRDGYDRLVIDGITVGGDATRNAQNIVFTLVNPPAEFNAQAISDAVANATSVIDDVTVADGKLTIVFTNAVTSSRYFNIADRLIVDMYTDAAQTEQQPAPQTEPPAQAPVVETSQELTAEPQAQPEQPEPADELPVVEDTSEAPAVTTPTIIPVDELPPADAEDLLKELRAETQSEQEDAAPSSLAKLLEETESEDEADTASLITEIDETPPAEPAASASLIEPTIISLSSPTPIGLAAFQRFNRLFIVIDRENLNLPPQMTGTGAREGWRIRDIDMDNEKAWVIDLPPHAHIRPESDGLLWRLVVSNIDPELDTVEVNRGIANADGVSVDLLLANSTRILRLTDPDYGDDLAVILMPDEKQRLAQAYDFIDFDILPAIVGGVVKPESDGLRITATPQKVTIGKRGGLDVAAIPQDDYVEQFLRGQGDTPRTSLSGDVRSAFSRVYYFNDWGADISVANFRDKRAQLDRVLAQSTSAQKVPVLLDLAKLTLSQAMGAEALGYLRLAKDSDPRLVDTPDFLSLQAAAHFLARHYDKAIEIQDHPALSFMPEIQLWRAAATAAMGDMTEALRIYPGNGDIAASYPLPVRMQLVVPLTRAFLSAGDGAQAVRMIEMIDVPPHQLNDEQKAAVAYLKGRVDRMTGKPDSAIENLYKAAHSDKLGPYGARSELLLVEDELLREVITIEDAIKRLERLRFAWRGDDLETEIYTKLGLLYIQDNQPRRGMTILKNAAENTKSIPDRRALVRTMAETYKAMFLEENFEKLDPLEAVTVYREFKELTPVGDEGNRIIDRIADKLVEIDLLERAASLLKDKMQRLGGGDEAIRTGLRVAAIELVDRKSAEALKTLAIVDAFLRRDVTENSDEYHEKAVMLKARALSEQGQTDRALFMLEGLPDTDDILRLRVDTAWRAGNWIAVSENLGALIEREGITLQRPATDKQARMILNQAVALNLSDQKSALQDFAAQYNTVMQQTPLYQTFRLVSRPSGLATLADRDTMMGLVSEVDLFQEFLDSTKSDNTTPPESEQVSDT